MAVDEAHFKLALSHFVSGVTVVTTHAGGRDYGMTVASFCSLSLHPPLVLVCIENSVRTHEAIRQSRQFAVNILNREQADVSNRFASRVDDRFAGIEIHRGSVLNELPLIRGAITTLECSTRSEIGEGDHTIFVGEVEFIATADAPPLVYYRSGYREIAF